MIDCGVRSSSLWVLLVLACDRGAGPTRPPRAPPPAGEPRAVLVVDWRAEDRSELAQQLARRLPIAVRVDGDRVTPVFGCLGHATYAFTGAAPRRERVDFDGGVLELTFAGQWSAAANFAEACAATHVATSVDTGAFRWSASTSRPVRGESRPATRFQAAYDGDPAACAGVGPTTPRPPAQCSIVLRLHLSPLAGGR